MVLSPGAQLGPYTVRALVGGGGMGEVYRAYDSRLDRDVAIKVIGSPASSDPDLRRRFDQEARLAASLDHPRICAVYDVGHDAGVDYLVMEFLEGETLAARLVRGPVPTRELMGCAIEIASALAYAHARDVVHRDIKPGNIFLTAAGVKVVDFGLATLRRLEHTPRPDVAMLSTQRLPAGERGVVYGTPQYLPPERLEGRDVDHRGDIYAFGAVLYEMATARPAFEAATSAALISAIISAEPPVMIGHGSATPEIEWVVRLCLKKNPDARWQSMRDVEGILKWIAASAGTPPQAPSRRRFAAARYFAAGAAAGLVLALLSWFAARASVGPSEATPSVAVAVPPPEDGRFTLTEASAKSAQLAISPDGRMLAFVGSGADRVSQIWIRRIDSTSARPIAGTANATYPFWSPDSRSLGFFAGRQLRRIDVAGGPPRTIADAPSGRGGAWNADNAILFAPDSAVGIYRVNADGTRLAQQTALADGDVSHRWPHFLPDGRHFLFFARNPQGSDGVYLASLDRPGRTLLVASSFAAAYAPPEHVLYVTDGMLMAQTLDLAHARLTGEPVPIVPDIGGSSNFYAAFSASATGVLAYARNASAAELAWFDRQGRRVSLAAQRAGYADFQLSRDGRYLAVARVEPHSGHPDIYVLDLQRGNDNRITSTRETDASPVWSPDATRLVFRSNPAQVHDLYLVDPNSSGSERLLLKSDSAKYPTDWSDNGQRVIYHAYTRRTGWDIWAVSAASGGDPQPVVQSAEDEVQGHMSRDGRWLAYTRFMSPDTPEVYVTAVAGHGSRAEISVNGGSDPHWSADGREVFYIAPDGTLMSVAVHVDGELDPGKPRSLFKVSGARVASPFATQYDVDPSGQRFLVLQLVEDPQTLPLNVLVNWSPQPTTR